MKFKAFARLVSYISTRNSSPMDSFEISDLESMVQDCIVPPAPAPYPYNANGSTVADLMTALVNGRKIDAIKAHRTLTGYGLKESKDAVEDVMKTVAWRLTA